MQERFVQTGINFALETKGGRHALGSLGGSYVGQLLWSGRQTDRQNTS